MRNFLEQTALFWIITRVIFLIVIITWLFLVEWEQLYLISIMSLMICLSIAYFIILLVLFLHESKGNPLPFLTRTFAGGLSLINTFSFIVIALVSGKLYLLLLAVWLFFFGLYDTMMIGGYRTEDE